MIKNLTIKNYTLLKDVSIDFKNGLTVVSGETGSGKSIILDALGLLLGKRVERYSIDKNSSKTIIEAVFEISEKKIVFFQKHNLDYNEVTVVRRELTSDGRSRAFINDTPVLLNVLSDFANHTIEVHAQHQSILLKDEFSQFSLIDKLAKSEEDLLNYQNQFQKYNQLNSELILIEKSGGMSDIELEFLRYQFEELEASDLRMEENKEIEKEISLLENAENLITAISDSEGFLNKEQGVLSLLSAIRKRMLESESFSDLHKRIDSVIIELNDVSVDLSSFSNVLRSDPDKLANLNNRLDLINKLLQKHRKESIEDLLIYQKEIQHKIEISKSFDSERMKKRIEIEKQLLTLERSADALNDKRSQILNILKNDIERHLLNLGMPHARFKAVLDVGKNYHKLGNTSISFLFSANKGGDLLEISKVASGGELSRLMLVIKYILTKFSEIDTLIFDEIDIGVSGEVASLMGDMMQEISKSNQLIAISHLPQIASKADEHLKVVKSVIGDETTSNVLALTNKERINEIAKLLSGSEVTSAAVANARVLLNQ